MKILLIDDELSCIESLEVALKPANYECVLFQDPNEGITAFQNDSFDVVITDIKMPGMSGIDVLNAILAHNPKAYVIITTGYADIDTTIEAVNNGAYAFFRKPFEFKELMKVLYKIEKELQVDKETEICHAQFVTKFTKAKEALEDLQSIVEKMAPGREKKLIND